MTPELREWHDSIARALEETVSDCDLRVTDQATLEVLRDGTHPEVWAAVYDLLPELKRHALSGAETIRALIDALDYAVSIIRNYEVDMRNVVIDGVSLAERGICQGSIYRDAVNSIDRRATTPSAANDVAAWMR